MITTLKGERPVEDLSPGDRIVTRDNGLQTVRRIERRDYDYGQLSSAPHLQPIVVTIGALAAGLPERDMLVSPAMRLVVFGDRVPFGSGRPEALVSASALADGHAIRGCHAFGVRYVHVVLDKHEVILANGIWAEAFQVHDLSASVEGGVQAEELAAIFPAAAADAKGDVPAATR
jgi:hypothetical protein